MKGNLFRSLAFFCCALALIISPRAVADTVTTVSWSSSGLAGFTVYGLVIDPDTTSTLYAATDGGVYKSTDSGAHWDAVNGDPDNGELTNTDVRCLVIDPDNDIIYAGTYGGGVFRTTDGGTSWDAVNGDPILGQLTGINLFILSLAIHPDTPQILLVGTDGGGVLRTLNGGAQWNNTLGPASVNTIAIDPVTPSTVYAGTTAGGVYKSIDTGGSWLTANTNLPTLSVSVIAINPVTHTTIYAGITGNGVFKSTNTGEPSWFSVDMGTLTVNALAINPDNTATLYAGTVGSGVYRSTTAGQGWGTFSTGLTALNVRALAIDPDNPNTLYAGTNSGVFKTTVTETNVDESSSDCFIATAAYGSPMEPQVKFLRELRDRFLVTNDIGRAFVSLYYQFSPPLARFIAGHEGLRLIVRWTLLPVVGLSYLALNLGMMATVILLTLFVTGAFVLVRSGRRRVCRNKVP